MAVARECLEHVGLHETAGTGSNRAQQSLRNHGLQMKALAAMRCIGRQGSCTCVAGNQEGLMMDCLLWAQLPAGKRCLDATATDSSETALAAAFALDQSSHSTRNRGSRKRTRCQHR